MITTVRLAQVGETDQVQKLFNSSGTVGFLGGFPFKHTLESRIRRGEVAVVIDETGSIIGANEAYRDHLHRIRFQLVAVRKDRRREGFATSLYHFWILNGLLEGRFQLHDTIIDEHPIMPDFLARVFFQKSVVLKNRVRRHQDMALWHGKIGDVFDGTHKRVFPKKIIFEVYDNPIKKGNHARVVNMLNELGRTNDADHLIWFRNVGVHAIERLRTLDLRVSPEEV